MSNQFNIAFDYPGLCALCHTEIADFNGSREVKPGIFRPVIQKFKENMREAVVVLSNSSKMTVLLCSSCADLRPEDMGPLMDSVIEGWQFEVDTMLPDWPAEKKVAHMKDCSSLEAIDRLNRSFSEDEKKRLTKPDKDKLAKLKEKNK